MYVSSKRLMKCSLGVELHRFLLPEHTPFTPPEGWVFRLVRGAGGKGGRIKGFVLAVCGVRGGAGKEGWWMKFEYSRCFRGQSSLVRSGTVVIAVRLGGYFVP